MRKLLLAIGACACTAAMAQSNNDAAKFAKTIKAADLKEKLTIVAGPEMEGRETAMPGQKKAAAYIEERFRELGLKPGNGDSYQMYYPVYQDELIGAALSIYNIPFAYDQHCLVSLNNAVNGKWTINNIAYVSYGISDSTRNDFNGIDVKGKWVMLVDATPADIDKDPTSNGMRNNSLNRRVNAVKEKGAIGVIVVSRSFASGERKTASRKGNLYMKKASDAAAVPVMLVSYQAAGSLLSKLVTSFAGLKDIKAGVYNTSAVINIDKNTNTLQSSNVLGLMEGTDKKDEYVILTAHYDHLGKRDSVIYYGADDDGSGTVSVIEMAEAFAEAKKKGKGPRRNILFMTVSGEEKGLWGSEYYSEHPVYPLDKTTVDLNTDMVGRIDPSYKGDSTNYVYVIGEDKLSSDLMKISDSINTTFKMELDRKYNDPKDPNRFYYRSDHYNFAKNGVPVIFYFNGVHRDYHRPTDTVDKINFDLMEKRVKFIFYTAWVMANRDNMLKRDIPLNIPPR